MSIKYAGGNGGIRLAFSQLTTKTTFYSVKTKTKEQNTITAETSHVMLYQLIKNSSITYHKNTNRSWVTNRRQASNTIWLYI